MSSGNPNSKPNYALWMMAISLLVIAACLVVDSIDRRRHKQDNGNSAPEVISEQTTVTDHQAIGFAPRAPRSTPSEVTEEKLEPRNLAPTETSGAQIAVVPATRSDLGGPQPVGYSVSGTAAGAGQLGEVSGRITLKGTPPAETVLKSDPICSDRSTPVMSRTFVVGESNGLADAVVFFRPGAHTGTVPPLTNTAIVSFTNCEVQPYVTAVMPGQPVSFRDGDGLEHKLYLADSSIKGVLTLSPKSEQQVRFTRPRLFVWVGCLEHPWESAYVCVMENPFFAVTDRNGNFDISNVPSGKYTVEIAHQGATGTNQITRTVVVLAGQKTELNVVLDAPTH